MLSALDVAAYILEQAGPMTAMKLQKLVYYSQAWSLVWDEVPLFREDIQAWANGPVVPRLYQEHKGKFTLNAGDIDGDPTRLMGDAKETVDAVLNFYGEKSAVHLSELTHREAPWRTARKGLVPGERGSAIITHDSMVEYYEGLVGND